MKIKEIRDFDSTIQEAVQKFVLQLTSTECAINSTLIENIIHEENSHLFFAINDQEEYVGMLTIGLYTAPTGKKAWIEDVVVDETYRSQGIGKFLMEFAIQFANEQDAKVIMLTSNPSRVSANKLYQKLDFKPKITNVYRMEL